MTERKKTGKKPTRQQRSVLTKHKLDPIKYLYVSCTTVQDGKKNLDRTGSKKQIMRFVNIETNEIVDLEV